MSRHSGWVVRSKGTVRITADRTDAAISAYVDVVYAALQARKSGDIGLARDLARSARFLVHTFGKRMYHAGPIVGRARMLREFV